jgi:predicted dehydrogenase
MQKVRLGIIGCGIAARKLHWPALKMLGGYFEIAAVCSRSAAKAKSFAKMAGNVPYTLNYKELLRRPDVDAVTVSAPIVLNRRIVEDALRAQKHVLVEKPIAANLAQAKTMLEFGSRYRQVMMVAENFRYRPILKKMKKLVDSGTIGFPYAVMWNVLFCMDDRNEYAQTKWRQKPQHIGGFITDGGVHNIAALRLLLGEIVSGCAWSQGVNKFLGGPDTFSLQFETANVKGVLNIFFSANGLSENRLSIMGKKGTLVLEDDKVILKRNGRADKIAARDDSAGYREEFLAFYEMIRKKNYGSDSFFQAYKDLNIIIKALGSAKSGRRFEVAKTF